jgi:CopG family nickel-responsive transcriptional regulator
MQRVTVTLDNALMEELDTIIAARGYQNRSEAIRDLARAGIREAAEDVGQKRECVAALVYTYDHAARQLSKRLTTAYHEHHELSLASLHVHLDHDTCLEVTVLKGKTADVQQFGEHVIAEARRAPRKDRAHAGRTHSSRRTGPRTAMIPSIIMTRRRRRRGARSVRGEYGVNPIAGCRFAGFGL